MSNQRVLSKISRRHFLNSVGMGGAGLLLLGSYGFTMVRGKNGSVISAIIIDFEKCAGCRTCEAVCSEFNHKVNIDGKLLDGLGNPFLSNIKVHHFNPDIDVPSTCALCNDAPCIEACPVDPHPQTGRKALYRDEELNIISNDLERCIGCQSCYEACKKERAGVIKPNPTTGSPEHICTLCSGNPQCVKNCPYEALTYAQIDDTVEFNGMAPEEIAKRLIKRMYNLNLEEA